MAFRIIGESADQNAPDAGTTPATPAPAVASTGFRLLGEAPDTRSWFQRNVSEPVTGAVAGTLGAVRAPLRYGADAVLGKDNVLSRYQDWETQQLSKLVPQSGTEAGIMAGTMLAGGPLLGGIAKAYPALAPVAGLAGRAGATMAQKIVPPLARIAGATAGGAAGGAVTGEGAGQGAALGAASSIAGEGMMTLAGKLVRSLPGAQTWIDSKMAKEVGQAIKDISAPLVGTKKSPLMAAKTAKDLQQLAVEGERKLGLAKGRIVQHIEGNTPPIVIGGKPLKLSEANAQLTEMGKQAFGPSGTYADKQAYHKLSDEISAGLDAVDPTKAARQLWEGAQANYRKGLGLVDMLTPKPTFTRGPLGVRLKTPTVQEYLANPQTQQELRSRLSPAEFNKLTETLTRGGGLGTKDVVRSLYPTTLTGGLLGSGLGVGGGLGLGLGGAGLAGLPMLAPNALSRYAGRAPFATGQLPRALMDLAVARGLVRANQPQP